MGLYAEYKNADESNRRSTSQMERCTVFMDWKTQYSKDVSSSQIQVVMGWIVALPMMNVYLNLWNLWMLSYLKQESLQT